MENPSQPARKSASVCLAYIAFLTVTYHLGELLAGILCAAFTLFVCFFASRRIKISLSAALIVAAALGCFSMSVFVFSQASLSESYAGRCAYVTAYAESCTVSGEYSKIKLRIDTADGEKAATNFRVFLYADKDVSVLAGDRVSGYFSFSQIYDDKDGFPSKLYFDGEAVALCAYPVSLKSERTFSLLGIAADLRRTIGTVFEKYLPDTSSLARGIMLGDKSGIDESVYGILSANGITHILCVSGLHVSILISAVSFVLSKMRVSKKTKRMTLCAFAFFYMFLTGFTVSVCRAGIMACTVACDNLTRRRPDSITTLLLTATALCLLEPSNVLNLSFRLSFLATAGVIAAGQNIVPQIRKRLGCTAAAKLCSYILGVLCVSVCAVAVCVPVLSVFMGKQSVLSPIGNLLCAPIAELYLILCFLLTLLSFVPFAGAFIGAAADICGTFFVKLSELLSINAHFLDISSPALAAASLLLVAVLILSYIFDVKDKPKITLAFAASSVVLMLVSSL